MKVPRIINQSTWDHAPAKLDAQGKQSNNTTLRPYLLAGRIKCAICGANNQGKVAKSRGKRYWYYKHVRSDCENSKHHLSASKIEMSVKQGIVQWSFGEDNIVDKAYEGIEDAEAMARAELTLLSDKRASLQDKLDRAKSAYVDGLFSKEDLAREQDRVAKQIEQFAQQESKLQN